jgi:hypothetical protein
LLAAKYDCVESANTILTHEIVGKTTLGIGLDEQPPWG